MPTCCRSSKNKLREQLPVAIDIEVPDGRRRLAGDDTLTSLDVDIQPAFALYTAAVPPVAVQLNGVEVGRWPLNLDTALLLQLKDLLQERLPDAVDVQIGTQCRRLGDRDLACQPGPCQRSAARAVCHTPTMAPSHRYYFPSRARAVGNLHRGFCIARTSRARWRSARRDLTSRLAPYRLPLPSYQLPRTPL